MKNKFYYYQLLDEREEQLMNKASAESFFVKKISQNDRYILHNVKYMI